MGHPLVAGNTGEKMLLLGNEAIVRGALEGGVRFVSCYPGTPSSEVPDTFYRLAPETDLYFEYSTNEKVALEVGGGAAMSGLPTLVTMKHVGVNVAADPLMTLAYVGTPGGLVLLSADDPGCHSSQNEQDNRYYARLAGMPCLEPGTAQEAKDMVKDALALSAKWQQPVMVRTTTRVNHLRGPVELGPLPADKRKADLEINPRRFVPIPAVARVRHKILLDNLTTIAEQIKDSPWNRISGNGEVGVIASGISRAYLADALKTFGLEGRVKILELGVTYPLSDDYFADFMAGLKTVLILEEGEPLIENYVNALAHKRGLSVTVQGKDDDLTRLGEYTTTFVAAAVHRALGIDFPKQDLCPAEEGLPMRPPNLCAGCSHRATYFAVRQVFGDGFISSSDIGCYTLGILPPLQTADFLLCMGSSISAGSGLAKGSGKPVIAFIGDSTFFHSGITGLINAVHNRHNLLVVIMDNKTTAMTGHQPHPGVDVTAFGENPSRVDIEAVVRGCGVKHVRKAAPFNQAAIRKDLEELKALSGVRVLISEEPCVLFARRIMGKKVKTTAYVSAQTEAVRKTLSELACPAFYMEGEEIRINEHQCTGCMVCVQACPDIKARKRS